MLVDATTTRSLLGLTGAATGDAAGLTTGTVAAARLPSLGASTAGIVAASGGGTTNFLRADGSWQPPGTSGGPASQLDANGTTLDVNVIADGDILRRTTTTVVGATCTAAGYALLDDADAAAQRTTLGLVAIASSGSASDLTAGTVAVARLPVMTATVAGIVPTPPNNTTTFLRGDGTFAAPTGGSGLAEDAVLARISLRI